MTALLRKRSNMRPTVPHLPRVTADKGPERKRRTWVWWLVPGMPRQNVTNCASNTPTSGWCQTWQTKRAEELPRSTPGKTRPSEPRGWTQAPQRPKNREGGKGTREWVEGGITSGRNLSQTSPTKRMWARIVCGVFNSLSGLNIQPCRACVGTSGGETPQEWAQASRALMWAEKEERWCAREPSTSWQKGQVEGPSWWRGAACGGEVVTPTRKRPQTHRGGREVEVLPGREEVVRRDSGTHAMQAESHGCKPEAQVAVQAGNGFAREPTSACRKRRAQRNANVARMWDWKGTKSGRAPVRPCALHGGTESEDTGRVWRARGRVVHGTQATKQRECTSEGKAECIADTQLPVNCCDRKSTGPPKKMTAPATGEVELLKCCGVIADQLRTKWRTGKDVRNEDRRGERERQTFATTPGASFVEEAITTSADQVNVGTTRESEWHRGVCIEAPKGERRPQDARNNLGGRGEDRRPQPQIWWGRHQTRTANEDPTHARRAKHAGGRPVKDDQVARVELAQVTERVRVHKADTRDGSTEGGGKAVHQQVEQERWEDPPLCDAQVNPRLGSRVAKTDLGQSAAKEIGKEVPETTWDAHVVDTNQRGFDQARVEDFLDVDESNEGVDLMAETQGVHKAANESVGAPTETTLRHVQLW